MPIHTEWFVPRRILITRVIGDTTIEEMRADNQRRRQMTESLPHPVKQLFDLTQLHRFPLHIGSLITLWRDENQFRPSFAVVYGKVHPVVLLLANIFSHTVMREIRVVATLKEALDVLAEHESAPV